MIFYAIVRDNLRTHEVRNTDHTRQYLLPKYPKHVAFKRRTVCQLSGKLSMGSPQIHIGSLTCVPLHPTFGAEIRGVDFNVTPLPDDVIKDIIAAQDRFGVTVYRNTGLNDKTHVAFSSQFGELEMAPRLTPNQPPRFSKPELFDAGNMDIHGNLIKKGTRRWWYK